jgi:hypothetical protein
MNTEDEIVLPLPEPDPSKNLADEEDSEDEDVKNRVGNVPREWYKEEPHIGYVVSCNFLRMLSIAARTD